MRSEKTVKTKNDMQSKSRKFEHNRDKEVHDDDLFSHIINVPIELHDSESIELFPGRKIDSHCVRLDCHFGLKSER